MTWRNHDRTDRNKKLEKNKGQMKSDMQL